MANPTVCVLALGGTIASASDGKGGVLPNLDAATLLAAVPGLDSSGVEVSASTFRSVSSASLTLDDLAQLSDLIAAEAPRHDGIVITQGTDTLEESSFYLDLVTDPAVPLVLTGAMRNPTLAGPDGPANLLAAIQVATNEQARGLGALVVFNDEIHAARSVRKAHTTSTAAFVSPDAGPLGRVSENVVRLHRRLSPAPTIRPVTPTPPANVAVVTTYLGDDGGVLDAIDERYQGLVIAGLGGGHVPGPLLDRIDRLTARMPVVIASRTGAGPILRTTYSFPGSDRDLARRGLISAGSLDPYKSRVLLHLLLASGADRATFADTFEQLS
ncbi:asparaginase [Pseudonocardia spinosispora]|uniref:asparaginase n=1 Tax=Pseudonocardia spinosispora TaxID=103441 RepID=UPI00040EFC02|nr:asparaginase [Pseudonocardia spinosispora]